MTTRPSLRVAGNYLLWRMGLRDVLPNHYIRRIPVVECGEPLCELPEWRLSADRRSGDRQLARRSVIEALDRASGSLPAGLRLLVVEAHRSHERQTELWDRATKKTRQENPETTDEEIDRLTNLIVADPRGGRDNGHQTGAAVDITLADAAGRELWMGTEVQEFSPSTPTNAKVDDPVYVRRSILRESMESAGFANYPGEWWHFSYGDQLWAAYRRASAARFGPVRIGRTGAAQPDATPI